jgi:hypothetical protein
MKITIYQAISSLLPGAEFSIRENDYDQIDWWDEVYQQPTKEEVEAEIVRLQAEYDLTEYQRQRAPEYPTIGDQLDALFHAGVFPPEMAAKIQEVKDKYPKPE